MYEDIFSKNLDLLMNEKDLTAVDLAKMLDVSKTIVSEWRRGEKCRVSVKRFL